MAPKILDWTQRFSFGGPRPTSALKWIVVHVTVNQIGTPAENVANYQISSESGSYHTLVDTEKLLRENTADWITWSTGNEGNNLGLHLSFVARGDETREQWLAQREMLRRGAWEAAHWAKAYGIPVVKLTPQQVAGKQAKGFIGHVDTRILGGTDHVDPGAGFPWDVFLDMVEEELRGAAPKHAAPQKGSVEMLTTKYFTDFVSGFFGPQFEALQRVLREVTGKFPSAYVDPQGKPSGWSGSLMDFIVQLDRKQEDMHANMLPAIWAKLNEIDKKLEGK